MTKPKFVKGVLTNPLNRNQVETKPNKMNVEVWNTEK